MAHKKYDIIKEYSKYSDCLIETGTYNGACIDAVNNSFKEIYSIELSEKLAGKATKKYEKNPNIHIIQGDSSIELGNVMNGIDKRMVIFIDAHYSMGGTAKGEKDPPMMEELGQIKNHKIKDHVIIIDDFNDYGNIPHYPKKEDLYNALREINNKYFLIEKSVGKKAMLIAVIDGDEENK